MATATKKCKVCGCEYKYCHTLMRTPGSFRWQDVACSPEHASIYFDQIAKSRSTKNSCEPKLASCSEYVDDIDEIDELFEEDFYIDDDEE